jgi:replication-associated recombination protein RarA
MKKLFGAFIHVESSLTKEEMLQNIVRIYKMRLDYPLRPPRVVLNGPPGSGKTCQAMIISQRFGLHCIIVRNLLEAEIKKQNKNSLKIKNCIVQGQPIDDDIVIPLVEKELRKSES